MPLEEAERWCDAWEGRGGTTGAAEGRRLLDGGRRLDRRAAGREASTY